jgi:hypothetical protein
MDSTRRPSSSLTRPDLSSGRYATSSGSRGRTCWTYRRLRNALENVARSRTGYCGEAGAGMLARALIRRMRHVPYADECVQIPESRPGTSHIPRYICIRSNTTLALYVTATTVILSACSSQDRRIRLPLLSVHCSCCHAPFM